MATLILVASLFLAFWSYKRKNSLEQWHHSETGAAKFFDHVFELSASLTIVLLFYYILLGALLFGWQWITVGDLKRLEDSFVAIQQFVDDHKITWRSSMAILIFLYVSARLWINLLGRDKPFRTFKKVKGLLHVVSTVAFLFASFTLLGSAPGKMATTLEIRLRHARTEYGVLRRDVSSALAATTVNRAFDNASKALPTGGKVPLLVDNALNEGATLRNNYLNVQTKYQIHDRGIEALLKRNEAETASFERLAGQVPQGKEPSLGSDNEEPPETITYREISKAKASIEDFNTRFRSPLIRFLKQPGGKEIVIELPKGPIDHLAEMLDPISESFPPFKPVFDVLKSTLKDVVGLALKRKLDELTDSALKEPNKINTLIPKAAQELADSAPPRVTPEQKSQFRQGVDALQREIAELRRRSSRLQDTMTTAQARANGLNDLQSRVSTEKRARRRTSSEDEVARGFDTRTDKAPAPPRFDPNIPEPAIRSPFESNAGGVVVTGCTCNTYRNGVLISSVPIPVGARCGTQICGPH